MKIICGFILISIFVSTSAFALDAEVIFVNGKAIYEKGKKKYRLKKGKRLPESTIIKTGKSGLVILKVDSNQSTQVIKVEKSSILKLTKLSPSLQSSELKVGSAFIQLTKKMIKKGGTGPKVELNAKSISMGVRGTQFFASYGPKGNEQDFWMCVNEGLVEVANVKTKRKVKVKEGEGIQVTKGEEISEPKPYEWTKKLNWNMDNKKGEVENTAKIEGVYNDILDQDYD